MQMTFGERLRLLRSRKKKTQKWLQEQTGVPQTTISGWERGEMEPGVTDLKKLARVLDVSVIELLKEDDEQDKNNPTLPQTG